MQSQIPCLSADSVAVLGEGSERNSGLCPHFCVRGSCVPALALMPDNSVPSHMSLRPFSLLSQCWSSEVVSLRKSVLRPFKRALSGIPAVSVFQSFNLHWFLQPEVMGTYLPGAGTLSWVAQSGAGIACS